MRKLAVGESVFDLPVDARRLLNSTGILVCAGERYRIDASNEVWSDAGIECTAKGQSGRGIQRIFKPLIRCRQALWFQLVAAAGTSSQQMLPIGLGAVASFTADEDCELEFFANDVVFMYWNNAGVIHVAVTREA